MATLNKSNLHKKTSSSESHSNIINLKQVSIKPRNQSVVDLTQNSASWIQEAREPVFRNQIDPKIHLFGIKAVFFNIKVRYV